jgi:hypothetical protein
LLEIFNAVKKEVKPYEKGDITARMDIEGKYDLWVEKENIIAGKQRNEWSFVAIIVQSNYVGFYYMPIYSNPEEIGRKLAPELLKLLKGKTCFHLKSVDKNILTYIKDALKIGYQEYKKNGWIN